MCITESHCCAVELNATLKISYTTIKFLEIKKRKNSTDEINEWNKRGLDISILEYSLYYYKKELSFNLLLFNTWFLQYSLLGTDEGKWQKWEEKGLFREMMGVNMLVPHFPWYPSRVWHMPNDSDFNIKMFISSPLSRILLTNKKR